MCLIKKFLKGAEKPSRSNYSAHVQCCPCIELYMLILEVSCSQWPSAIFFTKDINTQRLNPKFNVCFENRNILCKVNNIFLIMAYANVKSVSLSSFAEHISQKCLAGGKTEPVLNQTAICSKKKDYIFINSVISFHGVSYDQFIKTHSFCAFNFSSRFPWYLKLLFVCCCRRSKFAEVSSSLVSTWSLRFWGLTVKDSSCYHRIHQYCFFLSAW